ncbi:hypothetical protein A2V54_00145 [candidate division WWE3 bacterium RBG_19FT_COMBO_53_11]|uniref:Uncharacterized protein n=1 Tax=candidate division WWE3 bacterium RBG_19FT_COMBO_53_11 TaxID=1802613 RepID=A0A1F4UI02_UNCKA|nr:MAG: hypothetical protein A2V54_00145 [candidate division WWE3 bacterium RBG_19FT_COMBO_53_11]
MEGELVVTEKDHLCGRCRQVLPAKSKVWEVIVRTTTPNQWGNDRWIFVRVRYHPEHFGVTGGLGSDS